MYYVYIFIINIYIYMWYTIMWNWSLATRYEIRISFEIIVVS